LANIQVFIGIIKKTAIYLIRYKANDPIPYSE
jgi:hypothetical protein